MFELLHNASKISNFFYYPNLFVHYQGFIVLSSENKDQNHYLTLIENRAFPFKKPVKLSPISTGPTPSGVPV